MFRRARAAVTWTNWGSAMHPDKFQLHNSMTSIPAHDNVEADHDILAHDKTNADVVPIKLHWGVETALGIIHTIHVGGESSRPSSSSQLSASISWRSQLKSVASSPSSSSEQEQGHGLNSNQSSSANSPDKAPRAEDNDTEVMLSEEDDDIAPFRRMKRRRSKSPDDDPCSSDSSIDRSRSCSRSVTPIDSYHLYYGGDDEVSPRKRAISLGNSPPPPIQQAPPAPSQRPSRREIYLRSMTPTPVEEYLLAERILPIDLTLLRPYIERDLAVLTDVYPNQAELLVVEHILGVFKSHGGSSNSLSTARHLTSPCNGKMVPKENLSKVDWELIASQIEQWVLISPATPTKQPAGESVLGSHEKRMAQQFVQEMRRIARRKWRMADWDSRVTYQVDALDLTS
ncbi:hypothetical protein BGZ94_009401 [Podila epigama]|nr:hypothetical protein BGZ94_009401 [Podila epigama]